MEVLQLKTNQPCCHSIKQLRECNFSCGEFVFYWGNQFEKPIPLWVTGGFIDLQKDYSLKVHNPYQLLSAAATKTKGVVKLGSDHDYIEYELDFSLLDVILLESVVDEESEK